MPNTQPQLPWFFRLSLLLFACSLCLSSAGIADDKGPIKSAPDTLVICSVDLQPALQPWLDYRRQQGHRIVVRASQKTSLENRRMIATIAQAGTLRNVVIVGDSSDAWQNPKTLVPTDYVLAKVNVKFGSEPIIATDNPYADLDNDGIPELTIGRIPVDDAQQLKTFIQRIIEYEQMKPGQWQRKLNLVAGLGGFGGLVDKIIENTTKQILTELVPAGFPTTMTYASRTSPYCPDPNRFSDTAIERFNEGCMFWVYMGHGHRYQLDNFRLPDRKLKILDTSMVSKLNCRNGSPIAVCLSCYTGAHDSHGDCLAETMLRQRGGPISVVCGTRVTMPYAMSVLSVGMMEEYFRGDCSTLGELMLNAKKRMVSIEDDRWQELLEALGQSFSPLPDLLDAECREHIHLIHLLGDPLLRLKRPGKLGLNVESKAEKLLPGSTIAVSGVAPWRGKLRIEVAYQRDRFRKRPSFRKQYEPTAQAFDKMQQEYMDAIDLVCVKNDAMVEAGKFKFELTLPPGASGRCDIRAVMVADEGMAVDSQPIRIARQSREARRKQLESTANPR